MAGPLETLLATFGVSLILQQVGARLSSANNRPGADAGWMAGSLQIQRALSLTSIASVRVAVHALCVRAAASCCRTTRSA
jgi:branched-subunit amino acid ABC-type transport system permease component